MESLKNNRSFHVADILLGLIVLLFWIFPLTFALCTWILDMDLSSLSSAFFTLLIRSVFFTALQSAMTATGVILLGTSLAIGALLIKNSFINWLINFLGYFFFVLPGISVALLVLVISKEIHIIPSQGLFALVLAHIIFNLLFYSSQLQTRASNFLSHEGNDLFLAGQSLGATPFRSLLITLSPLLKRELLTWWPMVFYWSFTTFTTSLMLAGKPSLSSPELLLFYSLQSDFSSGRVLVLACTNILMSLTLYCCFLRNRTHDSVALMSSTESRWSPITKDNYFILLKVISRVLILVSVGILLFALSSPIRLLFQDSWPSPELGRAFVSSLALALVTSFFSFLFSLCLFQSSPSSRKLVFVISLVLSPTLVAASLLNLGLDRWLRDTHIVMQIISCGFFIALSQLSLMSIWIEHRIKSWPHQFSMAATTLGANETQAFWKVVFPLNKDLFLKIAGLAFLLGLGDIAISTLLAPDTDFAAGLAKTMTLRYDFASSKWLLFFILLTSGAVALFSGSGLGQRKRASDGKS